MVGLQKNVAAVMILGSAMLASHVLHDFAFPGILCMLGLLGLRRRFIWAIQPQRRIIKSFLYLLLLIIFAIHYRFGDLSGYGAFLPTAEMAWQTITRYFLAAMILVLYLGSSHTLPPSLALFHIAFCISAGQVLLLESEISAYRALELGAIVLTTFYVVTSRSTGTSEESERPFQSRRSRLAFVALLLLTINVGWIISSLMYQHQGTINMLSGLLWGERVESGPTSEEFASVGFSASGYISNVLMIIDDPDTEPVLTMTGDENPRYMRARAFDMYRDSEWFDYGSRDQIYPLAKALPAPVPLSDIQPVFRLTDWEAAQWKYLRVEQRLKEKHIMFTPLGTGYVEMPAHRLGLDENDIVYGPRTVRPYSLAYAKSGYWKRPLTGQQRRMLNIPEKLDPRIRDLADRICAGKVTTQEKIDAVIAHFRENYFYQLGMDVPFDQDPVTYFLLEGNYGYCEYFATGAALLLRLADVPTRYVTGFMVTERDPDTKAWIARNADAHAWTEAWDEISGRWILVEATVAEDDITDGEDDLLGARNQLEEFFREFSLVFYEYGFLGATLWLLQLGRGLPWLVLALILVFFGWRLRRRRLASRTESDTVLTLQRALKRADRRCRRLGFHRRPSETLLAFADRLARQSESKNTGLPALIAWYRRYAGIRYRRRIQPADVEELVSLAFLRR